MTNAPRLSRSFTGVLLFAGGLLVHAQAPTAQAQAKAIPIRTLAPATATSRDTLGAVVNIRALSDGRVFVNDIGHARVLLFDAALANPRVVIDTIGGTSTDSPTRARLFAASLIRYAGDTTLYVDRASQSLLVLDANGKVARVMALPRPQDVPYISGSGEGGQPEFDSKGRMVYHGVYRPTPRPPNPNPRIIAPPIQPDSAPIVRADFDTRRIDTLIALKLNLGAPFQRSEIDDKGNITLHYFANPVSADDQWAMLSDGTVAVISIHDYHIEWLDPDGTRRSSAKMPFDWKPLTDDKKQHLLDSLHAQLDEINSQPPRVVQTPDGPRQVKSSYTFPPLNQIPDYEEPFTTGAVKTDLNAQLWIVPHTSASAKGGVLYDVINRQGQLVERVQFPKDHALVGFGPNGAVYVLRVEGKNGFLERRTLTPAK